MSKAQNETPPFGKEEAGKGSFSESPFVVLPAPMELTVSYGTGTGAGPRAILDSSEHLEFFDEETGAPYWQQGEVFTLPAVEIPPDPADAVEAIARAARPVIDAGKFLLTLGGEHSVTAGTVRALVDSRGADDLGLLVVDAHLDLRDTFHGTPWSHACVFRRIREDHGLPIVYCGVRAVAPEEAPYLREQGIRPFYAHELDAGGEWMVRAVEQLPPNVYLSLDVDGLDPSVMPGTGAPEPGGLTYRQVVALIQEIARRRRLLAADCVEVAPIPGQQVSEFTAARIVAKLIGAVRNSKKS